MATRLNKRFILIVSAVFFVLAIGVAGIAYVVISGDAERQVRLGKISEANGNYKEAMSRYGRAIGKEPRNLEYYDLFENALLKVVPETRVEAEERYNRQYIGLLERRRGSSVDNPDSWIKLLDVYRNRAQIFNSRNQNDMWGDIQYHAQRMVEQFDEDGDEESRKANLTARGMRLHAMSMRSSLLKPDEEQLFESEFPVLLDADSKNPLVWESGLRISLKRAGAHATRRDDRLLNRELADPEAGFDTIRTRMHEDNIPDTPEILSLVFERATFNPKDVVDAQRQEIHDLVYAETERVTSEMLASDSVVRNKELVEELRRLTQASVLSTDDLATLLTPVLVEGKLSLFMNMMICQNFVMGHPAFAKLAAEKILELEPLTVSLQSMFQKEARGEAALSIFDAAYVARAEEQTEIADSETAQEPTIKIEDLVAFKELALREFEGEPNYEAIDLYLGGSISLAENDAASARTKFMEMSKSKLAMRSDMRFRYVPRLITAAVLTGERGAALGLLKSFVEQLTPGQGASLRLTIASEMIHLGRLENAKVELQHLLASDPTNEDARSMLDELNLVLQQVREVPGGIATKDDRRFGRIQTSVTEGRLEDARELLLVAIQESDDPAYKRYLVLVNIQLGREDEAMEVASTIENPEDDEFLQRILSKIEVSDPIERIRMLAEMSYEDSSSRIAAEFIALHRLSNSNISGNDKARDIIPETFDRVLADITSNRSLRQRLVAVTVLEDERSGHGGTPEGMASRIIATLEKTETDDVQLSNMRAIVAASQQSPEAGIAILEPIIERGIANAETWFIMGISYRELGRLKESVECLQRAVERSPNNTRYVSWYALSLEQGGEPMKALELLRRCQLAEATRVALQEPWLTAEAEYGVKRVALSHRRSVFQSDMDDSTNSETPILRAGNALKYARLLLIVQPERQDLLGRNQKPAYSPIVWNNMAGTERRSLITLERERRRVHAFEVLDLLEKVGRSDYDRSTVMLARAEAFLLIGDTKSAASEVAEILDCCGDSLPMTDRFSLIDLMIDLDDDKGTHQQFEVLALESNPIDLRRAVTLAMSTGHTDQAVILATELMNETGLATDRTRLVRAQLAENMLEVASEAITELDADDAVKDNVGLRYEILILDSNLQGLLGIASLREMDADIRDLAQATSDKDAAAIDTFNSRLDSNRKVAIEYFDKSIDLIDDAIELNQRDPMPLIHKHNMLRTKVIMLEDASAEADMIANAQRARDLAPMEWRTNRAMSQAYAVTGQPREAITALEQYFRRGGLHQEARETITYLAVTEGNPGIAIPSLKLAMGRDPSNPEWPRAIAVLLMEAKDVDGAAEMWWKVLELDTSPAAIDAFVEMEFRRDNPDLARLREVFDLIPDSDRARPELRGAIAVSMAFEGNKRRAALMMRDAYKEATEAYANGGDPIAVDRLLTYFFKLEEGEDIDEAEARLRELAYDQLGAHEYGALAGRAMQGGVGSTDLEAAKRYLRIAADLAQDEEIYKKALLHQLATVLYLTKDCDGAVRALQEVISFGNSQASTLNNLAYMLVECRNDPDSAIVYSTQAIRMSSSSPSYLDTHGYILFKLGRMKEAERFLARAVAISPSVSNLLHLAQLMHATGQDSRAEILIEKIGKDYPSVSPTQQQEINDLISRMG